MWNLKKLSIKDFQQHQHSTLLFPEENVSMLVTGQTSDNGADSNGSGKSTIIRAITIALLGFTDKSISIADHVRDGQDMATIELELYNSLTSKSLKITRIFFSSTSKSSKCFIEEDGVVNNQIISNDVGSKFILEELDLSKEDVLNYFLINQDNSSSFFLSSDDKKKSIISRFSNIEMVDDAVLELKSKLAAVNKQKDLLEKQESALEARFDALEEQRLHEERNKQKSNAKPLQDLQANNEMLVAEISTSTSKITALAAEIKQINTQIKAFAKIDVALLKSELKESQIAVESIKASIEETKDFVAQCKRALKDCVECPECNQKFLISQNDLTLEDIQQSLPELEAELKALDIQLASQRQNSDKIRLRIEPASKHNQGLQILEEQKDKLERSKYSAERWNTTKQREIDNNNKQIDRLSSPTQDNEQFGLFYSQTISKLESDKVELNQKFSSINGLIDDYQYWVMNFGTAGFKTYLVNKVLSSLEGYVNFYLSKLGIDIVIAIKGYMKLKSGDIREKIDILVSKDSSDWKYFERFSGGQKNRINICGILAIQKLLNLNSKSGGLNFLALDEVFEGLDNTGQHNILKTLELANVMNVVITHQSGDVGAKHPIIVTHKNGVSKIC